MSVFYKILDGKATLIDQDEALKNPKDAFAFAYRIKGADIEKCQEVVCKSSAWAYNFALLIEGADIQKCQKAACKDHFWAYQFARDIQGADLSKIKELYPDMTDKIDNLIMNKALR